MGILKLRVWSRDIPEYPPRNDISGVYLWYENHHGIDTLLYVGGSGEVYRRLLDHYKYGNDSSVFDYIEWKIHSRFEPCDRYSDWRTDGAIPPEGRCDCLPRFYVIIVEHTDDKYTRGRDREKEYIRRLKPLLNKVRYATP